MRSSVLSATFKSDHSFITVDSNNQVARGFHEVQGDEHEVCRRECARPEPLQGSVLRGSQYDAKTRQNVTS